MTPYNHLQSQHCNASWRGQLFFNTVAKQTLDHAFISKPELMRKWERPNYKSIVEYMQTDGYNENNNVYNQPNYCRRVL